MLDIILTKAHSWIALSVGVVGDPALIESDDEKFDFSSPASMMSFMPTNKRYRR